MAGVAKGEVPGKQPLTRYTELWSQSPFTLPPGVLVPPAVPPATDLPGGTRPGAVPPAGEAGRQVGWLRDTPVPGAWSDSSGGQGSLRIVRAEGFRR